MRYILHIIYIGIGMLILFPSVLAANDKKNRFPQKPELSDSILTNVILFAPFYEKIVSDYKADLYVKGKMNVRKRNHLLRVVPSMFRMEKHVKEYMLEAVNEMHYTAPNIYDIKVKAVTGTIPRYSGVSDDMLKYFNMNIYSSSLLSDQLLSPLAKNGRKHYIYLLDSILGQGADVRYKVLIIPRNKSTQLVKGYMIVSDQTWTIREIYLEGKLELIKFKVKIEMGEEGGEEFLPRRFDLDTFFKFVGNKIDGSYTAYFKYNEIILSDSHKPLTLKNKYDLTESFRLTCDSTTFLADSASFAKLRPLPLAEQEEKIYKDYAFRRDTTKIHKIPKKRSRVFWGQVGEVLLTNYTIDFSNFGSVRCSPLVNPLLVSYSHSNGISYRQDFKYNRLLSGDRLLRIVPRIGYNFTRKEFYWRIDGNFDYWPQKRASIHLNVGNGNRIYSSDILDELKQVSDSILDFDKIHLEYFKDLYFTLTHNVEVTNGLTVSAGFTVHKRTPLQKSEFVALLPPKDEHADLIKEVREKYISFAPRLRVEWTPGLYYYMRGKRKINLYSKYPTFSVDWERGIKGVFNSVGQYERLEFDMQHRIPMGSMRCLFYRVGLGAFTNQKHMYFVDFVNFSRRNLPEGWNDDMGGIFQLLDNNWYNSLREYVRGHLTYEAPFLLLRHLIKYTSSITNERLYCNVLFAPRLIPYIELGYGIGTHIFDAGAFIGFEKGRYSTIGFKFTFELFNK